MTNDYRRGSDGGRGSGRPSSRGRSGYQGTGRQSYNAGQSRGNDPASRLRGSGGPQVHNNRSRKSSSTEWLTGTPLPRRKAVMGFIGLGLGLGAFRLADYQIVEADKLRERADARRLLAQTLYAKRGTIYDRNGNVLASSVECRNIAVNPQLVEDVDKTVSALVKATGIDKKTCRKLVESDGTWVYIKRQVDEDDAAALEKKNLPGVLFEQAMKRVYPYGNLASQVLGVVNVDNDGLTGLEKQYNKLLTGTNGSLVRERARDGSYIAGGAYKKVAAVDGVDIVTRGQLAHHVGDRVRERAGVGRGGNAEPLDDGPVGAVGAADDVVVEHRGDLPALFLRMGGEQLAAPQPLFLAREQRIDDRRAVLVLREKARRLEHQRGARPVIVRTRGVAGEIHRIGNAAVDMTLHDHDLVGALAAPLDGDGIADQCGSGDARAGDGVAYRQYLKAIAALRADALELLQAPIDRRADAALGVGLRGQGVAGAEADKFFDIAFQPFGGDFVSGVGLGGERGREGRGKQKGAFEHAPCLPSPLCRCKTSRRAPQESARPPVRR